MRICWYSFGILAAFVVSALPASSQDARSDPAYFANWFARVDKTQKEQPHWITTIATTTPRLEEEFR